jgi:dihydrofolate reductase
VTGPGASRLLRLILVAAVGENGVIGRDGRLPWHIRSDLKYFRGVTMNRPVVMGRKTWPSVGKPLPGRTNIVVTRRKDFALPGVIVAPGLAEALDAARGDALRRGVDEIAVIGGTEIFAQLLPQADRLALTLVHASPDGDAFFPPIDAHLWREVERRPQEAGPGDDYGFTFVTYERTGAS